MQSTLIWIAICGSALASASCHEAIASGKESSESATAIERETRGNLVIENIPEIPPGVKEVLRQYQNTREHRFSGWTANGVLIATRFGEVTQIHRVDTPMGARRQITFFEEPVSSSAVEPVGDRFVFAKDKGGDEFYQGHVYDLKSGKITAFTAPGTRNGGFLWSDDGALAAWYQARDADPDYDMFVGDPEAPASARLVYDGKGAIVPVDWSADGTSILLQQYVSVTKSRLFVVNVESGDAVEINPDDDVAYDGGRLLSDGSILTVTDKDSQFRNLVRIDPDAGEYHAYTDGIGWDVSSYDLSPDETTVVFTINEGGKGPIKILDLAGGTVRDGPELPIGIAAGPLFDRAGSTVGFTFFAATQPADAWSFDVETLKLTRWTQAEVGGLDADRFKTPKFFSYPNADGMDIPAFVYRPEGDGPHPVVVAIHGGPEGQSRPRFSSTYQYWVNELGLAVVVPNVRGSAGYGKTYVGLDNGLNRMHSVEDIGALLDWIETQSDLDASRVVVYGGSYGGFMVLASLIEYGDRLAGGVDVVGISDFRTFLQNTKGYRRDLRRAEYGDERDPDIAAFFEAISPLRNAYRISKPLFVIQGLNDPRVPASEAEQILEAIRANGGDAWYLLARNEGHGFKKKSNRDYQYQAVTMFLRELVLD